MAMFGNTNGNPRESVSIGTPDTNTTIAKGTTIEGNLDTAGTVRVEGKVVGNVKAKAKVSQGETSLIDGNILSQNAELAGEVKGRVEITEVLVLKATAVIHGDIVTGKLVVESGATFNGSCKMGTSPAIQNKLVENKLVENRPAENNERRPELQPAPLK